MSKLNEDGTPVETPERGANAGVSERSEKEIEAAADLDLDDDEEEGQEHRDADDKGDADPLKVIAGLRKRNAKLTAQRNRARQAAQERDAYAERLRKFEERDAEAERMMEEARKRTPEGQKLEERKATVRSTIDETYGPGTSDYLDQRHEDQERAKEKYANDGISYLKTELDDHGIKYDLPTLIRWERAVGSELAEDEELREAYKHPATQHDAIQEAVNRVRDGLVNPVLKQSGAKTLERLERNREAVLGGGTRGAVAEAPEPTFDLKPPKDLHGPALDAWWADAREKYWEKLTSDERRA